MFLRTPPGLVYVFASFVGVMIGVMINVMASDVESVVAVGIGVTCQISWGVHVGHRFGPALNYYADDSQPDPERLVVRIALWLGRWSFPAVLLSLSTGMVSGDYLLFVLNMAVFLLATVYKALWR